MNDLLQEFCDSRGVPLRVDRSGGVIRGVKVLGLTSRNHREYLPEALAGAVSLYDGAKVNVNHPKGHPLVARDYQERIGVIRNVHHRSGQGIFADFHFNPKHYLSEQLIWDAEHAPENVGFSHNVQARTSQRGETTLVEEILRVHSVDLVADPATTHGLFESMRNPSDANLNMPPLAGDSSMSPAMELAGVVPSIVETSGTSNQTTTPLATLVNSRDLELANSHCQEQADEIGRLRAEVDHLRAEKAAQQRRATVVSLLAEYQLPSPDSIDPTAKALVSEAFVQSLLSAPDDQAIRRLIEERTRLVSTAQHWQSDQQLHYRRPVSRDQAALHGESVRDGKSFARSITT